MDCEKCSGNGEVSCYKCQTPGVYFKQDSTETNVCSNCSGTAYVKCHHCFGNGRLD